MNHPRESLNDLVMRVADLIPNGGTIVIGDDGEETEE
jgi:hypothetical protein